VLFNKINFSDKLSRKLLIAFVAITTATVITTINVQSVFKKSSESILTVLNAHQLIREIGLADSNIANSGQLVKSLEKAFHDVDSIITKLQNLNNQFTTISQNIAGSPVEAERHNLAKFLQAGNKFHTAIERLIKSKTAIIPYIVVYNGSQESLPNVLGRQELNILRLQSLLDKEGDRANIVDALLRDVESDIKWLQYYRSSDPDLQRGFTEIRNGYASLAPLLPYLKSISTGKETVIQNREKTDSLTSDIKHLIAVYNTFREDMTAKYEERQRNYRKNETHINLLYEDTLRQITSIQNTLENDLLVHSAVDMKEALSYSRKLVWIFSLLAIVLTVTLSLYVLMEIKKAFRDLENRSSELFVMNTVLKHEIDKREQAQNRLKSSEERYALAARGANDGLWDWKLD
jgi:PAS domain-containing protein